MPYYQFSVNQDGNLDVNELDESVSCQDAPTLLDFLKGYLDFNGNNIGNLNIKTHDLDKTIEKYLCGLGEPNKIKEDIGLSFYDGDLNQPVREAQIENLRLTLEDLNKLKIKINELKFFDKTVKQVNKNNPGESAVKRGIQIFNNNLKTGGALNDEQITNFINIVNAFHELVFSVLYQPIIIKIISLDTEKIKLFFTNKTDPPEIQFKELKNKIMIQQNLNHYLENLINFLYVDINDIIKNKNLITGIDITNIKNNNNNYYNLENAQQQQKTTDKSYIHINKWLNFIKTKYNSVESYNSFKTSPAELALTEFIINHMTKTYKCIENIHEFLTYIYASDKNNFINVAKLKQLSLLVSEQNSERIITYLKIRIDKTNAHEPYVLNKRFKIYLNQSLTNENYLESPRSQMVLKYDDRNIQLHNFKENEESKSETENYNATYNFGNFGKIFLPNENNESVANNMTQVINRLLKGDPVFIIGYGASGAGKTSSLIYFKGTPKNGNMVGAEPGVLIYLCNILGKQGYKKLSVKTKELFNTNTKKNLEDFENNKIPEFKYNENTGFALTKEYNHTNKHYYRNTQNEITKFVNNTELGKILIHLVDQDRFVKATTNNINSSRSHVLVFLKFTKEGEAKEGEAKEGEAKEGEAKEGELKELNLIVGDFAGVENKFDCDENSTNNALIKFSEIKRDDASGDYYYSTEAIKGYDDPVGNDGKEYINNQTKTAIENDVTMINIKTYETFGYDDFNQMTGSDKIKGIDNDIKNNMLNTKVPLFDLENPVFTRNNKKGDIDLGMFIANNTNITMNNIISQRTFVNLENYFNNKVVTLKKCLKVFEFNKEFEIGSYYRLFKILSGNDNVNSLEGIYNYLKNNNNSVTVSFSNYLINMFQKFIKIDYNDANLNNSIKDSEKTLINLIAEIENNANRIQNEKTKFENENKMKLNNIDTKYIESAQKLNEAITRLKYLEPTNKPKNSKQSYYFNEDNYTFTGPLLTKEYMSELIKINNILNLNKIPTNIWPTYKQLINENNNDKIISTDNTIKKINFSKSQAFDKSFNGVNISDIYKLLTDEIKNKLENLDKEKQTEIENINNEKFISTNTTYNGLINNKNTTENKLNNLKEQQKLNEAKTNAILDYLNGKTETIINTNATYLTFDGIKNEKFNKNNNTPFDTTSIQNIVQSIIEKINEPLNNVLKIIDDKFEYTDFKTIQQINNEIKGKELQIIKISLLLEAMCPIVQNLHAETVIRTAYYKTICDNRVVEGKFINESLQDLRDSMKIMLLNKSKDVLFLTPDFINECLSCYCPSKNECFNIKKDIRDIDKIINAEEKSVILNSIINGLGKNKTYIYEKLLFSIFCVFNGNTNANNPPPIPYVDINDFKRFWYQEYALDDNKLFEKIDGNNKFIKYSLDALNKIFKYADDENDKKLTDIVEYSYFSDFLYLIIDNNNNNENDQKLIFYHKNAKTINEIADDTNFKTTVENFLTMIDNSNAVSAIGTLEFVDLMGKFNSVNSICNIDTGMEQNTNYFKDLNEIIKNIHIGGNKTRKSNKETMAKKTRKNIA